MMLFKVWLTDRNWGKREGNLWSCLLLLNPSFSSIPSSDPNLISQLKPKLPAQGLPTPLSLFGLLAKSSGFLDGNEIDDDGGEQEDSNNLFMNTHDEKFYIGYFI